MCGIRFQSFRHGIFTTNLPYLLEGITICRFTPNNFLLWWLILFILVIVRWNAIKRRCTWHITFFGRLILKYQNFVQTRNGLECISGEEWNTRWRRRWHIWKWSYPELHSYRHSTRPVIFIKPTWNAFFKSLQSGLYTQILIFTKGSRRTYFSVNFVYIYRLIIILRKPAEFICRYPIEFSWLTWVDYKLKIYIDFGTQQKQNLNSYKCWSMNLSSILMLI